MTTILSSNSIAFLKSVIYDELDGQFMMLLYEDSMVKTTFNEDLISALIPNKRLVSFPLRRDVIMWEAYKTKEEFKDNCPCWYQILDFVKGIEDTDTRWYFDICYNHYPERRYTTIFKSYITEEYKDYILSVEANFNEKLRKYDFRIVKKVDNLR